MRSSFGDCWFYRCLFRIAAHHWLILEMDAGEDADFESHFSVMSNSTEPLANSTMSSDNATESEYADMDPFLHAISPSGTVLIVLATLAVLLCIPIFVWHIKRRSVPATTLAFWILLLNIFNVINVLIWPNDDVPSWWHGQGYCDVDVKLEVASSLAIVGAVTCIMRSLAEALNTEHARLTPSKSQRFRRIFFEVFYCFVLPAYAAVAHFVVQSNRYYIYALAGCVVSSSDSWLSVILLHIWPVIVSLVASYYAALVIIRLRRYRRDFASILSASSSGLNRSRFLRLFANAMLLILIYLPVQVYVLVLTLSSYSITAFDWAAVHEPARWQTVILVPTFGHVFPDRWIRVSAAAALFLCFGLGSEARTMYGGWLLGLGLGRIFPSLEPRARRPAPDMSATNTTSSRSVGSKARALFFSKYRATRDSSSTFGGSTIISPTTLTNPSSDVCALHTVHERDFAKDENASSQASSTPTRKSHADHPDSPLRARDNGSAGSSKGNSGNKPKQTWATAEDAMREVQQERDYEANVVGSLV